MFDDKTLRTLLHRGVETDGGLSITSTPRALAFSSCGVKPSATLTPRSAPLCLKA